jgi:hypothetical protein
MRSFQLVFSVSFWFFAYIRPLSIGDFYVVFIAHLVPRPLLIKLFAVPKKLCIFTIQQYICSRTQQVQFNSIVL